jgi:hypothetical protein
MGVLEALATDEGPEQRRRGVEVRRRLLGYVREHPEEMRPFAGSKRSDARRLVGARPSYAS